MTPDGWWETTLGSLSEGAGGFQTGPFGSELHASDYLERPPRRRRSTVHGSPAAPRDDPRADEGVPVIMPKDLAGGRVAAGAIARVSAAKAAELARHRVRPGDVVLARRGELGRCALMRPAEEGWLCGTGCVRLRPRPAVEPRYLIQYLRWRRTASWLEDHAVGQTMPSVNTGILARLPVRLPGLAEQRAIARALETLDAAVRAARAVVGQTRRVGAAVLRELLGPEASESDLPEDWRVRTLGEICTFRNGRRFPADEWSEAGLPIVRIRNLNGSRRFRRFAGYPKPEWVVEPGELLFAWAGSKGVSFGPCLWDGPRGVLNQHIFRVRPRDGISKEWLYETLRRITHRIEDKAHGFKASLVHVRKRDITGQPVPVPPYEEQCRIAERARRLAEQESLEREAVERAVKLRRGLRDDLFDGRVRCRRGSPRMRERQRSLQDSEKQPGRALTGGRSVPEGDAP